MRLTVYVEGGGDTAALKIECREAFRKLLERAGLTGQMPRIVACGSRSSTFDDFCTAHRNRRVGECPVLLVDSEDPVSTEPWSHLKDRDRWEKPRDADERQAQLMVTCMETWVMADRATLRRLFGAALRDNQLLPQKDLERRSREQVQDRLAAATAACGRGRRYEKGRKSFRVIAELDPPTLEKHLPHFRRLLTAVRELSELE